MSTHKIGFMEKQEIYKIFRLEKKVPYLELRPQGYKTFFMLNSLSMNFVLLINLKLLTIANSFLLNIAEHDIFFANKYENANFIWHFHIY